MDSKYRCTCEARVKFETRGHQRDATSNSIDEHTIEYWSPIPIPHSLQPAPPISCAVAVYVRIPRPHKFQTRQHAGQRALLPARLCSVAPKGQGESEKTRGEQFEPRTQSEGEPLETTPGACSGSSCSSSAETFNSLNVSIRIGSTPMARKISPSTLKRPNAVPSRDAASNLSTSTSGRGQQRHGTATNALNC